jgi:hypothetical protein
MSFTITFSYISNPGSHYSSSITGNYNEVTQDRQAVRGDTASLKRDVSLATWT